MAGYTWSYTSGTSDVPLLGLTIGDMFDQTAARFPGQRGARLPPPGTALHVSRSSRTRSTAARARSWRSASRRASASASGRRTAPSGPSPSSRRARSARSSSTSTRATGSPRSSTRCGNPAAPGSSSRPHFKTSDYTAMMRALAPELDAAGPARSRAAALPDLRGIVRLGAEPAPGMLRWSDLLAMADRRERRRSRAAPARAGVRRPDQHPVHERHHRLPEGRDAQPPQHPQQRLLHDRAAALHRPATGS